MNRLNSRMAQRYLKHLESDAQRYNAWLRTLLCAVVDGRAGTSEICMLAEGYDFGEWFYGDEGASLRSLGAYTKVAKIYHALHVMSEHIRAQLCSGERVSGEDLSVFVDQTNMFRKHVFTLEAEIREYLCALDPLTGVFNRHAMLEKLDIELQRALRNGHHTAIVLMDIDFFKQVNDRHGHETGDRALREAAGIISESLRDYDSMYRMGGEEFLICLPYLDAKRARIAADRLRAKLRGKPIRTGHGMEIQITASFGASVLDGAASVEESIARADRALYAAKQGGRDRVEVWEAHAFH